MQHIDRLAYANRLARLHPAYKVGCSALALGLCLAVPHPAVGLGVLLTMLALSILWAGLPATFVLKLALGEASFLALGVLGVAVSGVVWTALASSFALKGPLLDALRSE